jgi:signal transduction histidine kinase
VKLLYEYLKYHIKSIILFVVFTIIFAIVLHLYSLPLEPVLYAAILCLVLAVIITLISFFRFRTKHIALLKMIDNISVSKNGLPAPKNIIEEDYIKLIDVLHKEKCEIDSQKSLTISELNDYYTLWVHQIKTPISAIKLLFKSKGINDIELEQQLFKIEQYAEMALQYIRSESDTTDFVIREYSLDAIIRQAIRKYSKLFILKKISLNYTPTDAVVITDEKWLLFVIEQILSNSLKYTQKGTISIYMDDRYDLTLIIEDTGKGIEPEDIPRIFEKGYTGYAGRIDKKSTGIGLYLSKKILSRLSHKIRIYSVPDKGTKVLIDLSYSDKISE